MKRVILFLLIPISVFGAEKNYFVFESAESVKFQISYDYGLLQFENTRYPDLYLNYTQTSWWAIGEDSSPFKDTNYQPKLYLAFDTGVTEGMPSELKIGAWHESNGEYLPKSRSWDRAFIDFQFYFFNTRYFKSKINLCTWEELRAESSNQDIIQYRGNVYNKVTLETFYSIASFKVVYGDDLREVVYEEYDIAIKIPKIWNNVYLYYQYCNGYGERVVNYNQKNKEFYLGVSIRG